MLTVIMDEAALAAAASNMREHQHRSHVTSAYHNLPEGGLPG